MQGFFKKQELELLIQRRSSRKKLADAVINADIIERYYQNRAVRRIGETFEVDNQRKALLVMATGTSSKKRKLSHPCSGYTVHNPGLLATWWLHEPKREKGSLLN